VAIKKYKPTSNGRRNMTGYDFSEITASKPEKTLLSSQKQINKKRAIFHCSFSIEII